MEAHSHQRQDHCRPESPTLSTSLEAVLRWAPSRSARVETLLAVGDRCCRKFAEVVRPNRRDRRDGIEALRWLLLVRPCSTIRRAKKQMLESNRVYFNLSASLSRWSFLRFPHLTARPKPPSGPGFFFKISTSWSSVNLRRSSRDTSEVVIVIDGIL